MSKSIFFYYSSRFYTSSDLSSNCLTYHDYYNRIINEVGIDFCHHQCCLVDGAKDYFTRSGVSKRIASSYSSNSWHNLLQRWRQVSHTNEGIPQVRCSCIFCMLLHIWCYLYISGPWLVFHEREILTVPYSTLYEWSWMRFRESA